jgi:Ca2+-binding RTX toxin-like protein
VTAGLSNVYTNQQNNYSIQAMRFADGTVWEWADIVSQPMQMQTTGNGYLPMEGGTLIGTAGADTIDGSSQDDVIYGGEGDDTLNGNNGDDTLIGDAGDDILSGGAGDDTYVFNAGDGQDAINESAGDDRLVFGDIDYVDLRFGRSGNNLVIDVLGEEDRVTLNNWYANNNYQVETVSAGDMALVHNQMDLLIQSLASFGAPQGVDGKWTEEQRESLAPILSSYWQPSGN